MSELKDFLAHLSNKNITPDEIDKVAHEVLIGKIEIPTNLSVESTLKEIQDISSRLYRTLEQNPRDAITQSKIISLLEMKTRILGMNNIKPDMQDIIDAEINNYKKRILEFLTSIISNEALTSITTKLTAEGL